MIENCGTGILPELNTLNLSHNSLKTAESLQKLIECQTVSILDLSYNRIDDILIVKILAQMPELRVLVLTGNPVVNEIPSYRKTLINECVGVAFSYFYCCNLYNIPNAVQVYISLIFFVFTFYFTFRNN